MRENNYRNHERRNANGRDGSGTRGGENGGRSEQRENRREAETPMDRRRAEVVQFLRDHTTSVLIAETGAGKTTRGPECLLEALGPNARVAVTVPRVSIATTVSKYVADRCGLTMGKEVGYQVRFDDRTDRDTNLNFMTDGVMLRKITSDPLLRRYDAVMVDEAHERSLNIDFTLGLLKQVQQKRREEGMQPLKIVISSATIEKEKFAEYIGTEAIMEIEGKMFPVEERYAAEDPGEEYTEAAAEKCREIILSREDGDILVFMPGREEIQETIDYIKKWSNEYGILVLPLHATIAKEEQAEVIAEAGNKRRIIVATNIAETGVTVKGVRHVVDPGFSREIEYDAGAGISALVTKEHSLAGLKQRRGRAGRLTDGFYHALYTRESLERRPAYTEPEIRRSNLAGIILTMKKNGISDIHGFDFLDRPNRQSIDAAIEELRALGALDNQEKITLIGREMEHFPVEPKIGRMIVEGLKRGCAGDIATIAGFIGEKQVFVRPQDKEVEADIKHSHYKHPESDFLTFLKIFDEYNARGVQEQYAWAKENFLRVSTLNRVRQVRMEILRLLKKEGELAETSRNPDIIGRVIFSGLQQNITVRSGRYSYSRPGDWNEFFIHPSSSVFKTGPAITAAERIFETTNRSGYTRTWLSGIQNIKPEWITEIAPHLIETDYEEEERGIRYDPERDSVGRSVSGVLRGTYIRVPGVFETADAEEAVPHFAEYLANTPDLNGMTRNNEKVAREYHELYSRNGGEIEDAYTNLRPFEPSELKEIYRMLLEANGNAHSIRDLERKKINLRFSLNELVPEEVQERIRENTPDTVTVNGKEYSVKYDVGGDRAGIVMAKEEICRLDTMPTLPSGRPLTIVPESDSSYGTIFREETEEQFASFKEQMYHSYINTQWRAWDAKRTPPPDFDPMDRAFELPSPEVYGTDPISGEDLLAYPFLVHEYGEYRLDYSQWPITAEETHKETLKEIEKIRGRGDTITAVRESVNELKDMVLLLLEDVPIGADRTDIESLKTRLENAGNVIEDDPYEAGDTVEIIRKEIDTLLDTDSLSRESQKKLEAAVRERLLDAADLGLPTSTTISDIQQGYMSVPERVLRQIRFPGFSDNRKSYIVVAEIRAISPQSPREYIVAQIGVDTNGQVWFADERENIVPTRGGSVWEGGIAESITVRSRDDLAVEMRINISQTEEDTEEKKEEGREIPMSEIENLERRYGKAKGGAREGLHRNLVRKIRRKLKQSDRPIERALLEGKLRQYSRR